MKFKSKISMENYEAKKNEFINLVKEGVEQEKQDEAFMGMINGLADDVRAEAKEDIESKFNELNAYSNKGLSAEEVKFFNAINTEVGYKDETLLPQTTIDKIFDEMVQEHPILTEIGLQTAGLRMRILKADKEGQAVWGKIFGEIKGQLDATFSEEEISQSKLTAFVVIPNDLKEYGPAYIERFVRLQITEAFATAIEASLITGDGNDKPIGLNRQVQEGVSISGGVYPVKVAETDALTFANPETTVKELTKVMKHLSVKENGKSTNISGKVVLLVNPEDAWDVKTQHTSLNANGVYVTALPFNVRIIESEFVPTKQIIAFVSGRYDAYVGGGINIKAFDQTLALEDCTLYTAKQFAYGKAEDNKAAAVYTLEIPVTVPGV